MKLYDEIRHDREAGARHLVAEYKNRLYSAALMMGCDEHEGEDLVFRTFAQAIAKIRRFKPPKHAAEEVCEKAFFNWVFTILVNFRRMDVRKQQSRIEMTFPEQLPDLPINRPDAAETLSLKADAARLRDAVMRLPEALRMTVVLRYFEDLQTSAIAKMLKIPEGTVRSRLYYAKQLIYSYLTSK